MGMLFHSMVLLLGCMPQEPGTSLEPEVIRTLHACAFGPDRILASRSDGSVWLLDGKDGTTSVPVPRGEGVAGPSTTGLFARFEESITHLTASPDLRSVAAHRRDGVDLVWPDFERNGVNKPVPLSGESNANPELKFDMWLPCVITPIQWSHDGAYLLTHRPHGVQWWSRKGKLLQEFGPATGALFSPVDNVAAIHSGNKLSLVRLGQEPIEVECDSPLGSMDFSPDGQKIAVGGRKSQLRIIEVRTGTILLSRDVERVDMVIYGHPKGYDFGDLRWSPNGKWIGISLGRGCIPAVLSAITGDAVKRMNPQGGRMGEPYECSWTPDNRMVFGFMHTQVVDPLGLRENDESWHALHYQIFGQVQGARAVVLTRGSADDPDHKRMVCYDLKSGEMVWGVD